MKNLFLILTIIFTTYIQSLAQAGYLDTDFGNYGTRITEFSESLDAIYDIEVQPDGKILAGGTSGGEFIIACYSTDGMLDENFGDGGFVLHPSGERLHNMTLQADGKIVAAGTYKTPGNAFFVVRYHPDGTLDESFDGTAEIITAANEGPGFVTARAVTVLSDGKIVVGGEASYSNYYSEFAVARYHADGSLDSSFGSEGKVTTHIEYDDNVMADMVVYPNGKILACGITGSLWSPYYVTMARYQADGALDGSFSVDGKVADLVDSLDFLEITGVALQPNGNIIVSGSWDRQFMIRQYKNNGSVNQNFGEGGNVVTTFVPGIGGASDVLIQPDGKILAAGYSGTESSRVKFSLARYDENGVPDYYDFGGLGEVTTTFYEFSQINAITVQPDGKILAGGKVESDTSKAFVMARYISGLEVSTESVANEFKAFSVYPNPVKDDITLSYQLDNKINMSLKLLDMKGDVITEFFNDQPRTVGEHTENIKLPEALPKGVYAIVMSSASGTATIKILK